MPRPEHTRQPVAGSRGATTVAIALSIATALLVCYQEMEYWRKRAVALAAALHLVSPTATHFASGATVDIGWYPPSQTSLNNLTGVASGTGVYGFLFNSSETPNAQYGTYNWCNMPHVRKNEYVVPPKEYELHYVELVSHAHVLCERDLS